METPRVGRVPPAKVAETFIRRQFRVSGAYSDGDRRWGRLVDHGARSAGHAAARYWLESQNTDNPSRPDRNARGDSLRLLDEVESIPEDDVVAHFSAVTAMFARADFATRLAPIAAEAGRLRALSTALAVARLARVPGEDLLPAVKAAAAANQLAALNTLLGWARRRATSGATASKSSPP